MYQSLRDKPCLECDVENWPRAERCNHKIFLPFLEVDTEHIQQLVADATGSTTRWSFSVWKLVTHLAVWVCPRIKMAGRQPTKYPYKSCDGTLSLRTRGGNHNILCRRFEYDGGTYSSARTLWYINPGIEHPLPYLVFVGWILFQKVYQAHVHSASSFTKIRWLDLLACISWDNHRTGIKNQALLIRIDI